MLFFFLFFFCLFFFFFGGGLCFEKLIFLNTLFWLDVFNLMIKLAMNKFQRSRLTFDLSGKVAHIGIPSTY